MKTYLYRCDECKKEKERPARAIVPSCCGKDMIKVYGDVPIIYKGNGFYTTDKEKK